MPIFAPFSFTRPIPKPVIPWSPADFTNVQYWWRADLGVTTGTGGVSNWVDQINSFDMKQTSSGNRPAQSTNATYLNSKEVISFNGTSDFLTTQATPASRGTSAFRVLMVYSYSSTSPGPGVVAGTMMVVSGPSNSGRFWLDGLNNKQRIFSDGLATSGNLGTYFQDPIVVGAQAFFVKYEPAGNVFYGLNTLTETSQGLTGLSNNDWPAGSTVGAGALVTSSTNNAIFLSRYLNYDLAEVVYVYDGVTSDEMLEWKNYVNTRYGTIIS